MTIYQIIAYSVSVVGFTLVVGGIGRERLHGIGMVMLGVGTLMISVPLLARMLDTSALFLSAITGLLILALYLAVWAIRNRQN